jgi:hypothetical protein
LGLTYFLAAEAAGITYKTFNEYMNRGKTEKSGKYHQFAQYVNKRNANTAKTLLEHLNSSAKAGDTRICLWILERRFASDFGRRVYKKTNVVSENINKNLELIVNDADGIWKKILEKFVLVRKIHEPLTS